VRIYPHRNARFHLPDDPHIPVILIAEGSGILKMAVSMAPCEINWEGFSSSSADVSA
jgi:sulfite reductase (NADPH) flavoprotein alpha-component